jgi:hypothetical protein
MRFPDPVGICCLQDNRLVRPIKALTALQVSGAREPQATASGVEPRSELA